MTKELVLRLERLEINKRLREMENLLKENSEKLKNILIEKYGFSIGDVIGGNTYETNKIFVIKDFGLNFNEFIEEPQEELTVVVYHINKNQKIDKKKSTNSIHSEKFASRFKVLGKYDFEKDEIVFSKNIQ